MTPQTYLQSFEKLNVGAPTSQLESLRFAMRTMEDCPGDDPVKRQQALSLYEQLSAGSAIDFRVTCLADCSSENEIERTLFDRADSGWFRAPLERRMEIFRDVAMSAARRAFANDVEAPDYLIQVSCTGYDSPHATQKIASAKNWGASTQLLHIGHMGCYAALPVSAMSSTLLKGKLGAAGGKARASLLFVELCSLHFDPRREEPQQVVMNSLFADGAIRFDVSVEQTEEGFALLNYAEELLPDTEGEMTWALNDSAFGMTLGRAVPVLLKQTAPGFVERLLRPTGLDISEIHSFAIHPGGPKIVDYVGEALGLRAEQIQHSRDVLRARGNMSSCTVPYIWDSILRDPAVPTGAHVLSLAFGPGLTIAGNVLRKQT